MFHQQPASQRSFCSLCREVDHTRAQCALACLQPPATSSPAVVWTSQPPPTRRRPETALRICISWGMHFPRSLYLQACVCHLPATTTSPGQGLPQDTGFVELQTPTGSQSHGTISAGTSSLLTALCYCILRS